MKKKVSISNAFSEKGVEVIKSQLHETFELELGFEDKSSHALIIRSKDRISSDFLKKYPDLKIVASATSGFDHMSAQDSLVSDSNVFLTYTPEANAQSASELTVFHILNFIKKGDLVLKPKDWREPDMLSSELCSKAIGIIGLGRIGKKVVKVLQSFGCDNILTFDPYLADEDFKALNVQKATYSEVLKSADILSLHCPLTKLTKRIINRESLKLMKKSSLLVNCARGELVNTGDLLNSLNHGEISGACLDVFDTEPLNESSKLRNHPLIQWSPHIGAFTEQAQIKSAFEAAQQIKSWFKGDKDMLHSVPPKVAWAKDL